jgi:uncharacterized membrane protein
MESTMRTSRLVFLFVILIMLLESVRLWLISPATMAAHFNVQGTPDRFVPKLDFFGFELQTVMIVIIIGLASQLLLVVLPLELINVPNRSYWLAPERREATREKVGSFVDVMFTAILVVIHMAFELAVSANLQTPIRFAAAYMIPMILSFFIISLGTLFWLARSFRKPRED